MKVGTFIRNWWIQYKQQLACVCGTFWRFLHDWNAFQAGGEENMLQNFIKNADIRHCHIRSEDVTTAGGQNTTAPISRIWEKKIQLINSWASESLKVISRRRRLRVSYWSVSEFRGLKDCGAGLPRLDRDSYWVHLSLGSDKGLRASDESDNSSRPCSCPTVLGFLRKSGRKRAVAPKLQLERLALTEFN